MAELPLNSNGKVDRRKLPQPVREDHDKRPIIAPRNPLEETWAQIWSLTLRIAQVSIEDNFFELGGDSILALKLISRARQRGLRVTLKDLFNSPTIRALSAIQPVWDEVPSRSPAQSALDDQDSLEQTVIQLVGDAANVADFFPLSPMQQGILFHSLFDPAPGRYVEQFRWTLRSLNTEAFNKAWQMILHRYPVLRSAFFWEGLERPVQVVLRQAQLPIEEADLRGMDQAEQEKRIREHTNLSPQPRGFDFRSAPLMRLRLCRTSDEEQVCLWSYHHLLLDGWSRNLVLAEVEKFYEAICRGEEVKIEPDTSHRSYVEWLGEQDLEQAQSFWRQMLHDFISPTSLIDCGHSTADAPGGGEFAQHRSYLPQEVTLAVSAQARKHGLTLNTVVLGMWAFLLSRYSGEADVLFGSVVSGRPAALPDSESMVGMFINTLPVRVQVEYDAALIDCLKGLQSGLAAARQFEYSSLAQVQRCSGVEAGKKLFNHFLIFENYPGDAESKWEGTDLPALDTGYPLYCMISPGERLCLHFIYDSDRFDPGTIERMAGHYRSLLGGMVADAG
ncbi:MAG TPA: condensation domain-containing protein, partial [Blastocatellia bacterium]